MGEMAQGKYIVSIWDLGDAFLKHRNWKKKYDEKSFCKFENQMKYINP